jgi:hypothetical protein
VTIYYCSLCGLDMSLTVGQVREAFKTGRISRPACPMTRDGLHVVSDEQFEPPRLYCQVCGESIETPLTSSPMPRCVCGAVWWASFPREN